MQRGEAPAASIRLRSQHATQLQYLHRPPQAEGDAAARDGCLVQRHNGAAMPNEPLRVLMFLGSTRAGRIGGRVGSWARRQLEARGHSVETVDPLALASHDEQVASDLRIFPMRRPYFFYPEAKAPPVLEQLAASVKAADAYVMVTPVIDDMQVSVSDSLVRLLLAHPATLPTAAAPHMRTAGVQPRASTSASRDAEPLRRQQLRLQAFLHRIVLGGTVGRHARRGGAAPCSLRAWLPASIGNDTHPKRGQTFQAGRQPHRPSRPGEMGVRVFLLSLSIEAAAAAGSSCNHACMPFRYRAYFH
jgi:hypothetical protein